MSASNLDFGFDTPSPQKKSTKATNSENTPQAPVDIIEKVTGAFGHYQLCVTLLVFLSKFFIAFHHMAIVFLSPKITYTCNGVPNKCPCSEPKYDTSVFTKTIVTEWNLICDKKVMDSWAQSIFQVGVLLGSIFFGMASDRFGRRTPLLIAVVVVIVAGVATALMKNYYAFGVMRFLTGASTAGIMVIGFVVLMEYVGKKHREVISALYQVPFNMGHIMLPGISYFNRDYVNFELWISAPATSLLIYFCCMPESARWLISVKRPEEGIETLTKAAKMNHRATNTIRAEVEAFQDTLSKSKATKGNVCDLFRTPNMRKHIIAMAFNWLTCSYCFYGISQYMGQMSGDIFSNVAIGACFTLAGTLLSIPLMKLIGRRTILIVFNFICALCLVLLAFLGTGEIVKVCLAAVGQVSSFIVFVVVYLYCSELFPTVVRNAALGLCSMMARVGSVLAPFVIYVQDPTWLPPVLFAILPLLATFISFLLPETKGCELANTIEEGEMMGKKKKAPEKVQI